MSPKFRSPRSRKVGRPTDSRSTVMVDVQSPREEYDPRARSPTNCPCFGSTFPHSSHRSTRQARYCLFEPQARSVRPRMLLASPLRLFQSHRSVLRILGQKISCERCTRSTCTRGIEIAGLASACYLGVRNQGRHSAPLDSTKAYRITKGPWGEQKTQLIKTVSH